MPGQMPPTALLLVNGAIVEGEFTSYLDVALYIGILVDNGQVIFNGEKVHPTYCVDPDKESVVGNAWTDDYDIIKDWAKHHMCNNLPTGFKIYRYLK